MPGRGAGSGGSSQESESSESAKEDAAVSWGPWESQPPRLPAPAPKTSSLCFGSPEAIQKLRGAVTGSQSRAAAPAPRPADLQ